MVDFNADTKKEISKYFIEGVHKVTISSITADKTQEGKEFFEFNLIGEAGEEGSARIYWTEKAAPYSFNTVRDIFVHNTVEQNKQLIREKVDATKNTDELLKLASENLKGKQCWYKVEKNGTTYRNMNGEEKNGYDKNVFGYEPKMKQTSQDDVAAMLSNGQPVDINEVPFN